MRWFQNVGLWVRRQMTGRYGMDALGRTLAVAGLGLLLLALITGGVGSGLFSLVLETLALAAVVWFYRRFLSRNYQKRSAENRAFLARAERLIGWFRLRRACFAQRKDYAFFRCPSCRQIVRVPKGKGRIRITCRKCGFAFEKKT
ncbi:MAG: hypothetical protein IKQ69_05080 [Oscillospiraceae bacterium]|nr:hypothetical protein [Oscillospiraceae bacterium]